MKKQIDKEQRLEQEKEFQDQRVLKKEDKRFISDLSYLHASFYNFLKVFNGKKILNIGCGTGTLTVQLAKNGNDMIGIDISPESIKQLKKEIKEEGLQDKADAVLMDAENLKFPDENFYVGYGVAILHHLDLAKALPELKRVIKKDGRLFFIEPSVHNPIIKRYRKNTPHMRSKFEHPLSREDIKLIKKVFPGLKITGYYFLQTLMPSFVKHSDRMIRFRRFLDYADRVILTLFPFFKMYCYSIILEMKL